MHIISVKFVSESKQGMIYDVEYKTDGNWFNRSEIVKTKIFLSRIGGDDKFWRNVANYFTGETMPNWDHFYGIIMHDYELNVKPITKPIPLQM